MTFDYSKLGNCYEQTGRWIIETDNYDAKLVHGKIVNPDGREIDHAWIEFAGALVWEPEHDQFIPLRIWYKIKVKPGSTPQKYNKMESERMMLETKHFGPWIKKPNGKYKSARELRKETRDELERYTKSTGSETRP